MLFSMNVWAVYGIELEPRATHISDCVVSQTLFKFCESRASANDVMIGLLHTDTISHDFHTLLRDSHCVTATVDHALSARRTNVQRN
jgi:hypothetical protein